MRTWIAVFLVGAAACGGGGGSPDAGDDAGDDILGDDDTAPGDPDAAPECPRVPGPADADRFVVLSRPYTTSGGSAPTFEVLRLSAAGELTRSTPPVTFDMARTPFGAIAFTPDGKIGMVAQDNGTLGVFSLDADGTPTVIDAGFDGGFYAGRVVADPRGDRAWVLDGNTRNNGGGIYEVAIGCDGTPTSRGLAVAGATPGALVLDGDRALAAAGDLGDGPTIDDVMQLDWTADPPVVTAGVDAFGDEEAIIGGGALTADGTTFLVGDVSQFSKVPNRIAVVDVSGAAPADPVTFPIEDPESIVASPFGPVAVVSSAFSDAIYVIEPGGKAGEWQVRGEVAYAGGGPLIPGDLAAIMRGGLRGRVLVSELSSIRQLQFDDEGGVTDVGSLMFGEGLEEIGGAIGVQP